MKKKFSILQLLFVILILAGLIIAFFKVSQNKNISEENVVSTNNIIEQSRIIDMSTDIMTLSKSIDYYEVQYNELPLKEGTILQSNEFTQILTKHEDTYNDLKVIDLDKTKEFHTKLLLGYEKEQGDRYLYSTKTKIIYYEKGLEDENGNIVYTNS